MTPAETRILGNELKAQLKHYVADTEAARKLIAVGESKADPNIRPVELAAYTVVARILLNLDETMTKE